MLLNLFGDKRRLAVAVIGLVIANLVALANFREEVLRQPLRVFGNHFVGGFENGLRRAIILLQLDDLRPGEVMLKVQDDVVIRAAKRIDRLIEVAHHAEAAVLPERVSGVGAVKFR